MLNKKNLPILGAELVFLAAFYVSTLAPTLYFGDSGQ